MAGGFWLTPAEPSEGDRERGSKGERERGRECIYIQAQMFPAADFRDASRNSRGEKLRICWCVTLLTYYIIFKVKGEIYKKK